MLCPEIRAYSHWDSIQLLIVNALYLSSVFSPLYLYIFQAILVVILQSTVI